MRTNWKSSSKRLLCLALVLAMFLGLIPTALAGTASDSFERELTTNVRAFSQSVPVSEMSAVHVNDTPFAYQDNSALLGQKITAIEIPVMKVAAIDGDQTFTLNVVAADSLKTGSHAEIRRTMKLTLPVDQLAGCTADAVNKWIRIDGLNLQLAANETLAFGAADDKVTWGFVNGQLGTTPDCAFYASLRTSIQDVGAAVKILFPVYTTVEDTEAELRTALAGKSIAFMGDSITTWQGYSNNASRYNSTLGNNCYYYRDGSCTDLTVNDTWWMQTVNQLNLTLTANNSSSGSRVLGTGIDSHTTADQGYESRPYHLDDNTVSNNPGGATVAPDIIVVYMGVNDAGGTAGSFEAIDFSTLITENNGAYQYATPGNFAEAYAVMIHKIKTTYPNAELFLCNLPETPAKWSRPVENHNPVIAKIAKYFGAHLVDFYSSKMSGAIEYLKYALDDEGKTTTLPAGSLHPNAAGFDVMTETLIAAMKKVYLAQQSDDGDGLVAHWTFDELTSDGKVKDATGNGHDGTLYGTPELKTGKNGNSIYLNGSNQYMMTDYAADLDFGSTDSFTLSAWAKNEGGSGWRLVAGNGRASTTAWYGIYASSTYQFSDYTDWPNPEFGAVNDQWHQLTAAYDGSTKTVSLYYDGQLAASKTVNGPNKVGAGENHGFLVGCSGANVGEYFTGAVDNVRVYNRALRAEEAKALYEADGAPTPVEPPVDKRVKWTGEWPNPAADTGVKNIIFDTDAGPDGDDTGALTMLLHYMNEGKVNLLATVSDTSGPFGAPYLSAINTYYGYPDIPVGTLKTKDNVLPTCRGNQFNINLTARYETSVKDGVTARDAVDVYREVLSKAEDSSVTIVVTGMQTNLMNLLKSEADKWSDLDGKALVAKKVKLVSIMGGQWPTGSEFNIENDTEAAKYVCDNWPTPIVYSGYTVGEGVHTGPDTGKIEADSPLRTAWWMMNSWDQTAVLYAVEGDCGFWTLKRGDADFNGSRNSFTENNVDGARAYLVEDSALDSKVAEKISALANAPKKNNPDELEIHAVNGNQAVTTGTWTQRTGLNAYNGDLQTSAESGATMSLTFVGTSVDIYGATGVDNGKFDLYVDETKITTVDTSAAKAPTWHSQWLYTVDDLEKAEHTVKLVLTEDKAVGIDFFKYVGAKLPPEPAKLLAHWTFDDFTEDGKVKDVTGNGHDGEPINAPTYSAGVSGNGVKFNGSNQAVTVPYAAELDFDSSRSYTLSLWAKNEGGSGWRMTAGHGRHSRNMAAGIQGKWYGFYAGGDGNYQFSASGANYGQSKITSDWQLLTATYDAQTNMLTVYNNGMKVGDFAGGGDVHAGSPYGFLMGWSGQNGSTNYKEYFNGMLDDVRAYSGVLSDAEVKSLYDSAFAVQGVTLSAQTLTLKSGEQAVLTATVTPANAKDKTVTWSSSDPAVAAVDENGNVTAGKPGTAKITVRTNDGGKQAECAVTVTAAASAADYQPDACVKVIFDTDIDSDVDDAGALAVLASYAQQGKAEILGVASSATGNYQAASADAILHYYGFRNVPIGADKLGVDKNYNSKYNQAIAQFYENKTHNDYYAEDAVTLYRRTLAAQPDQSVVLIFVGTLNNLEALLKSPADEISPLTGKELVAQKVKLVSAMAGIFPSGYEHNIQFGAASAIYVAANCPVPIMYSGWEIGSKIKTGGRRGEMAADDPVRKSYDLYFGNATSARESWDLTSVVFAVEGLGEYWTAKSGEIQIEADGKNSWTDNNTSKDAYLVQKMAPANVTARIDALMVGAKKSGSAEPYVTIVDDADSAVHYAGGTWRDNAPNSVRYASTGHNFNAKDATVTLEFEGIGIEVFGGRDPAHGKAEVYLDGKLAETIDTYQPTAVLSTSIFKSGPLTDGKHTIQIKILHEKADAATEYYTDLDYFRVIGSAAPAPEPDPEPTLVAHWTFDEQTSDGKVKDATGNGHDGTIRGEPALVDGASGSAIRFSADGQLVVVPDHKDLQFTANRSFTLSTWVKREANSSTGWKTIVAKGRLSDTQWYGLFLDSSNQLQFGLGRNGYQPYVSAPPQDAWQLITVVQDGKAGKAYVYVDGVLSKTYSGTFDSTSTGYPFVMGGTGGTVLGGAGNAGTKTEYFRGQLDDMRLYNYALGQAEIQALYDAVKNPPVDKTALKSAITLAEGKKEADYCAESWNAMQTALAAAKTVNENRTAAQEHVDTATANLTAALDKLQAHTWRTAWSSDADSHWHECSKCHAKQDEDTHDWGSGRVTTAATCTTAGEKIYTCSDCGATKTETIHATGHDYGEATYKWSADGKSCTAERVCQNDKTHKETETAAASYAVTTAPTCTSEGEGVYTASFKNKAFSQQTNPVKIAATGHTLTEHPAKAPTELAEGNIAYWECSNCGKKFKDEACTEEVTDVTIPKLTPAPTPVTPVTPSEPAKNPFNPNAGSNVSKFPFLDVPSDSWYYSSVKAAWENDLIDGVTANEFKPDATLTVAQTIKLAAALHQLDRTGEVGLKNGGANWYDSYVNYAVTNGIIEKDYANYTQAQMNASVTRGEFVHIFHGAEEAYKAINTVADNAIPDVKTTDKFAAEIYEFYRAGILTGSDAKGTFHSASTIKRSEAAAILLRMFEASARKSMTLK